MLSTFFTATQHGLDMCEFTLARARKPLAMEEAAAAVGAPGGAVGGGVWFVPACRVHGRLHEKRAVTAVCGRISRWVSRWVYMLYVICYMLYRCYMLYVYQGRAKKSPTFTPPWGLSTVEWYKAESNKW